MFVISGLLASLFLPRGAVDVFWRREPFPPRSYRPALVCPSGAVCLSQEQTLHLHVLPGLLSQPPYFELSEARRRRADLPSSAGTRVEGWGVFPPSHPDTPASHLATVPALESGLRFPIILASLSLWWGLLAGFSVSFCLRNKWFNWEWRYMLQKVTFISPLPLPCAAVQTKEVWAEIVGRFFFLLMFMKEVAFLS